MACVEITMLHTNQVGPELFPSVTVLTCASLAVPSEVCCCSSLFLVADLRTYYIDGCFHEGVMHNFAIMLCH